MEKEKFIYYLENPALIDQTDIELLEDLANKYPFFQLAHTLIAKYTYEKESLLAPQKIRRAAAHLYDRNALRQFIHAEWEKTTPSKPNNQPTPKITSTPTIHSPSPTEPPKAEAQDFTQLIQESDNSDNKDAYTLFFDNLNVGNLPDQEEVTQYAPTYDLETEKDKGEATTPSLPNNSPEEISETMAMDLFSEGKQEEAILMYKKLIKKYPGRKSYFQRQLAILTDDESYLAYDEDEEQESEPLPTVEILTTLPENKQDFPPPIEAEKIEPEKNLDEAVAQISYEFPQEHTAERLQTDYSSKLDIHQHTTLDKDSDKDKKYVSSFFDDIEDDYESQAQPTKILYENDAILLFNQGKTHEAIEVYEKLIKQNPERKEYYLAQIQVLKSFEQPSDPAPKQENKVEYFFEKIEATPSYVADEEISEINALSLFNEGKTDEAIEMYHKLMLKYPEKRSYYESQIEVLKS